MAAGPRVLPTIVLAFLMVAGAWQAAAAPLPNAPHVQLPATGSGQDAQGQTGAGPASGPTVSPAPATPPLPVPGYRNGPPVVTTGPLPVAPVPAPRPAPHVHAPSAAMPGMAPAPYQGGSYPDAVNDVNGGDPAAQPTRLDTDDDAAHRARFSLDRNWALAHTLVTAVSRSSPSAEVVSAHWDYDTTPLAPGTTTSDVEVASFLTQSFDGADALAFRPLSPGLHHLTLTVTFVDAGLQYVDRVTSPLYVEATALSQVAAEAREATWNPDATAAVQDAANGDPNGLAGVATQTVRDAAGGLLGPKPNVLVLGDFLGPDAATTPLLVPLDGVKGLLAPMAGVPGFNAAAGLGAIDYTGATTATGEPTTHVGGTLARSLVASGSANVLFASVLSPATGALDRDVVRNALLLAAHGGQSGIPRIDAVLWGLPASTLLPATVQDAMRPDLAVTQTPNLPLAADAPLPAASLDWHGVDAGHATGAEVQSVLEEVLDVGSLLKLDSTAGTATIVDALHDHLDQVYARDRPLVEAVWNDFHFDAFLQEQVLALARQGIAVVVPSESCAALAGEFMSVVGLSDTVGTVTVADGTRNGPAPDACKGPDRRAAAHGNGIDFVADPRPRHASAADLVDGAVNNRDVNAQLGAGHRGIPYVANSLGAAARVAQALGSLRAATRDDAHPWDAQDLVGMLARQASPASGVSAWAQGTGFVDPGNVDTSVPPYFLRGTGVTFSPYNLQKGESIGVVQIVVSGAQNVQAAKSAPASAWGATGQTDYRFLTDETGHKVMQDLSGADFGHLQVHVRNVKVDQLRDDTAMVTLTLDAVPAVAPAGSPEAQAQNVSSPLDPPREWLLPGLYSGHTWISTPTGIIQLPINIGVGTIYDVYRFLAPDTPVSNTAVCLGPPFQLIGDLTGLRKTAMELEHLNLCIYFTDTDSHGVARFYTPLPLPYTLKSWFDGIFRERGGGIGEVYPHVKRSIFVPSPLNLTGIAGYAGGLPGSAQPNASVDPGNTHRPAFVDLSLPYPLAYVPVNNSIPVAIAVNWRFRDNMETDQILPTPGVNVPEFIDLLSGGLLPDAALRLTQDGLSAARRTAEGALQNAPEHLDPLLNTAQDTLKGQLPVHGTTLDALLGAPVAKALPVNLEPDPGACQFGYGHHVSPALTTLAQQELARAGGEPTDVIDEVQAHLHNESWWPDTLTVRTRTTLDQVLGLGAALPLCTAEYPINLPQPNEYPTKFTYEMDLHLEATLLVVCMETVMEVECYLIIPGVGGSGLGNVVVAFHPDQLLNQPASLLTGDGRLQGTTLGDAQKAASLVPRDPSKVLDAVQNGTLALPHLTPLTTDGHVALHFEVNGGGADLASLHYIAIPLPLLASGFLDPLVGAIEAAGVDPKALLDQATLPQLPGTPAGGVLENGGKALAQVGDLLRDSAMDLLRIQPYVEIRNPSLFMDAWWWTDSFFDVRIFPSGLLPRATMTDCDRGWQATTDPALWANPSQRWPANATDPTCKRDPATGQIVVVSGTTETSNGITRLGEDMNLGEDFWWLTHPNINQAYYQRGLRFWDPHTLQPDTAALQAAGYPWPQPEFFENVLEFWNDKTVKDVTPNELHIHSPGQHNHHQVQYTKHCTDQRRYDALDGHLLNDPTTGQFCFDGLLAYPEGDGWMNHQNSASGTGVYDPHRGLDGVPLITLKLLDDVGSLASSTNQVVWDSQVGTTPFGSGSLGQVTEDQLGIDPGSLRWWERGDVPTANGRVYSDMYTNSSFMLSQHDKSCAELYDFTVDNAFPDLHPRWRVTCPWEPSQAALDWHAAHPADPIGWVGQQGGVPGHWDWLSRHPDTKNLAGDHLRVVDPVTGRLRSNAYQDTLNPLFFNGTYRRERQAYADCAAGASDGNGWPCSAGDQLEQLLADFPGLDHATSTTLSDGSTLTYDPFLAAASFLGLQSGRHSIVDAYPGLLVDCFFRQQGQHACDHARPLDERRTGTTFYPNDSAEDYVTVPLPSNPERWFGPDKVNTTEWDGFYRNLRFRELDASPDYHGSPTTTFSTFQDDVIKFAPLVRAWLAGDVDAIRAWLADHGEAAPAWLSGVHGPNPYWTDVHGTPVDYAQFTKLRDSLDPENPKCGGLFWLGQCHAQVVDLDVGDLSFYGRAHYWGREAKPKTTYIPQGSTFARWNRDHLQSVAVKFGGDGLTVAHAIAPPASFAAAGCGSLDGWQYWIAAPSAIDLVPDGWALAPGGPPAPFAGPAPAGLVWWMQSGEACKARPWDDWRTWSGYVPAASGRTADGDDLYAVDLMLAYYRQAGVPARDGHDPLGMARQLQSQRAWGNATGSPGCWADGTEPGTPAPAHSRLPHVELDTFEVPFDQRFEAYHAGFYHHTEANSGGSDEPVPATKWGVWCGDTKAHFEREYIPLRLPRQMMGGDPNLLLLPPVTPYRPGDGAPADVLILGLGAELLPKAARAVLSDAGNIATGAANAPSIPALDLGPTLDLAFNTVNGTGIPQAANQLLATLPVLPNGPKLVVDGGSPVVPLVRLTVAPDVQTGELLVQHTFAMPGGDAGMFMASTDNGLTWSLLPIRGAPGVVGDSAGQTHLAVLDVGQFRGSTLLVGARVAGPTWPSASWTVQRITALPAGAAGFAPQTLTSTAPANPDLTFTAGSAAADVAALQGTPTAHKTVLVTAPLVVPADASLTFQHVDLLLGDCGGRSCPVQVLGSLHLDDVNLNPVDANLQLPTLTVLGELVASHCRVGGLLSGLAALGGRVELHHCWLVGGTVGALSLFGSLEVTDSVLTGQALGAYTLGSNVRLEHNLFVQDVRAAGTFDESWGSVRDNIVLHTKQAGFLVRSPLGGGDLAILGNTVEETGTAIGATLDLEDRVLALDPRDLSVPVAARDRIQGNHAEWASLEGINAGALSDPVLYGNTLTHDNIGTKVGMLDAATIRSNDIYSNVNAWREAILRGRADNGGGVPGRGDPAEDGNLWTGLWQGLGLGLPVDATGNYWGPGPIEPGTLWPSDVLLTSNQVDLGNPANQSVAAAAPFKVALTAPGYGGGLLPHLAVPDVGNTVRDLAAGDLVAQVGSGDLAGTAADATQMAATLTDQVRILGYSNRTVPMQFDVAPGVTGFTLRGTFHASGLHDVFGSGSLLDLQDLLAPQLPLKVPDTAQVTRTVTQHVTVPAGSSHGDLAFSFDGIREAFADWEVVSYEAGGAAITPDATATKAARVDNALIWPLLVDVVPLVDGLAYGTIGVVNGTVQEVLHQSLAATLPTSPSGLANANLPLGYLPDGTLALDGTPSLAALAHSQAPVRTYEFRYSLSSEPGAPTHPLGSGFGMGRALALPAIPEGATLRVEARATDASGLTSPWTALQLLQDKTLPTLDLGTACLPSTSSTVSFHAADPAPAAGRPSGVATVQLAATAVRADGTLDLAHSYAFVQHGNADTLDGTWQIPFPPGTGAGAYVLTGAAQDRAGHVRLADGAFALDVVPPGITPSDVLAQIQALLTNVDPTLGVPNPNLGLATLNGMGILGTAAGPLTLPIVASVVDPAGSCGLATVEVQQLGTDGAWHTLFHHDVPGGQTSYSLPASDTVDLAPLDGHTLDLRIVATDRAGHSTTWDTGAVTIDLRPPTITLPNLPECVNAALTTAWSAHEAPGAVVSGLRQAKLVTVKPDSSTATTTLSLPPGALDASGSYTLPLLAGDGAYTLYGDASDLAGNALAPSAQEVVKADHTPPAITLQAGLASLVANGVVPVSAVTGDGHLSNVNAAVDDTVSTTCGLVSAILDSSTDGATWTVQVQKAFSDGTAVASLGASPDVKPLDGKRVTFRVRATDAAGNTATASKANVLVDLSKPLLTVPPVVPAYSNANGFTVAWTAADDASKGEASGIATQQWKLYPTAQPGTVLATGDATHTLVKFSNPTTYNGVALTFELDLTDRAGNVATWTAPTLMDTQPPTVSTPNPPSLDVVHQAVTFAWGGSDPGSNPSGIDHFILKRIDTPHGSSSSTTTTRTIPGTQTSVSDDAAANHLVGDDVRYSVAAVDRAGNQGSTFSPASVYVNFVAPTVGYTVPSPFGRTVVKGTDIDVPYAGTLDLGAALGTATTVVSAAARPATLTLSLSAVHSDPNVASTLQLTLDGATVGATSAGTNAWTYSYALGSATTDVVHTIVAKVTGNNGLASQQAFRFYVPGETSLTAAEERANAEWSLTAGASFDTLLADRVQGSRSVKVDAGSTPATATWATDNPSPRLAVSASVRLDRAPTTSSELLTALDAGGVVRAAVLVDSARALSVQTGQGTTATGATLGTGWQDVRLVLSATAADLYVGGKLVGNYATSTPAFGLAGIRFGGAGVKEVVDGVFVRDLSFQLNDALAAYLPIQGIDGWTATGTGTVGTASLNGVGTYLEVQGATNAEGQSPTLNLGQFSHVVLHFRMADSVADATQAFRFADAAGHAILIGTVVDSHLQLTGANGDQTFVNGTDATWHRVDVYLEGPAYAATLDQGQTLVGQVAWQAVPQEILSGLGLGSLPSATQLDDLRAAADGPDRDTTFAQWPPDAHNWHLVDQAAQAARSSTTFNMDPFSMSVNVLAPNNQPAYLWTDKTGVSSRYVAEVAYRPVDPTLPPVHQAVLAALKADGTVGWSITMADDGSGGATGLYYNAPDGTQTRIVSGLTDHDFHAVRVVVDERAGTLKVLHDETTVLSLTGAGLPATTKLAVGDVFGTVSGMTGSGQAFYDDLSLFPT